MSVRLVTLAILTALAPSAASAQYVGDRPRAGTIEIGGGATWTAGYDAGTASADETRNPPTGSGPLQLFLADGTVGGGPGVNAWLGVYLSPHWSIEGGVHVTRPKLTAHATNDFEGVPNAAIEETLTRYLFGGSVVYQFSEGRAAPFVFGGGGYSRELDSGNAIVQTGNEVHGGGGLRYWLGSGHRFGLRVEARLSAVTGVADLKDSSKRRLIPIVAGGVAYLF